MDIAPEKFELSEWMPIIRKLLWLLMTVLGAFAAGSVERGADGDLSATQSTAAEIVRGDQNWEVTYAALQDYVAKASACDTALESFNRHRSDESDWRHVVRKCHTDGEIE